MSRTHATGSAITYGKRYLKNMIFDLRFKEKDDDGNAAGNEANQVSREDEAKLQEWADALRQCDDLPTLKNIFADAWKFAKAVGELQKQQMTRVYNECKARLQ